MTEEYAAKTDEELVRLSQAGDREAMGHLLNQYKSDVRTKARGFYLVGADQDDVIQEGMIGLYKAIRDYRPEKEIPFKAFADLCVHHQIVAALRHSNRLKQGPLNNYISLNRPVGEDEDQDTFMDVIPAAGIKADPQEIMAERENARRIGRMLEENLTDLEKKVLYLFLEGLSYTEISEKIDKNTKTIDNALQRIRKKVQRYLDERDSDC